MTEAKRPLKALLESEIAAAPNDSEIRKIRAGFETKEKQIEVRTTHTWPFALTP